MSPQAKTAPVTRVPTGRRSKQTRGTLTAPQLRDSRYRRAIQESRKAMDPAARWYCVEVMASRSLAVGAALARGGLEVYVMERRKYKRVNAYVRKKRRRWVNVCPGYIFIGVRPGVNALAIIHRMDEVARVVGVQNMAGQVPRAYIERISQTIKARPMEPRQRRAKAEFMVKAGDAATVRGGWLDGRDVFVEAIRSKQKMAVISGAFMESASVIEVPIESLDRRETT